METTTNSTTCPCHTCTPQFDADGIRIGPRDVDGNPLDLFVPIRENGGNWGR